MFKEGIVKIKLLQDVSCETKAELENKEYALLKNAGVFCVNKKRSQSKKSPVDV